MLNLKTGIQLWAAMHFLDVIPGHLTLLHIDL